MSLSIQNTGMDYQGDAGGTGGGGFQNYGGGGSPQQSSQGQQQRSRRSYDEQTLIPVTIKMALGAVNDASSGSGNDGNNDGNLCLADGRKLTHIKLVAAVRSIVDGSTNVLYELEDGTGLIEIKQWFDDNDCTYLQELKTQTLKENIYVKVVGQIKLYDNKCMIIANSIRPLISNNNGNGSGSGSGGNELTHHMLSVIYSAEKYKRSMDIVNNNTATAANYGNNGVGFNGIQPVPRGGQVLNHTNHGIGGGGSGGADDTLRREVIQFIQSNSCKFLCLVLNLSTLCHLVFLHLCVSSFVLSFFSNYTN